VIWNPNATRTISKDTHHHACDFNIFEGMTVHGVCEFVLVRGRICAERGNVRVAEGFGRFIPTPVRPPFVYDIIEGKVQSQPEEQHEEKQNGSMAKRFAELDIQIPVQEPISAMLAGNLAMPAEGSLCSTPSVRGRVDGKRDLQESSFSISGTLTIINYFIVEIYHSLFQNLFRGARQVWCSSVHQSEEPTWRKVFWILVDHRPDVASQVVWMRNRTISDDSVSQSLRSFDN